MDISKRGFTLIEILVVIGIITILSTVGMSAYISAGKNARDQQRIKDLTAVKQALELYRHDNSSYPKMAADLTTQYLETVPKDGAYNQEYQYQAKPDSCTTAGRDCTGFIICAKKEGMGSFDNPADCSSLSCDGANNCDMGLTSD